MDATAAAAATATVVQKKPSVRLEVKAGLVLPVSRIYREVQTTVGCRRVSTRAKLAAAAGSEAVVRSLLLTAAKRQELRGKKTLKPFDISRVVQKNGAFSSVFTKVIIANGGVVQTDYFRQKEKRERHEKRSKCVE